MKGILLSFFLLILGLFLCTVFNPTLEIKAESLAIDLDDHRHLVTRVYTPTQAPAPYPVMVLCHGVNNSKEMMTPLAVELAREGIAAVVFDFGGYGESYRLGRGEKSVPQLEASTLANAQAVFHYLHQYPNIYDPEKMGIVGHSMGGITALQLAEKDSQLRSTLLLSINGIFTPTSPANVWLGVGVYEQLNPATDARSMLNLGTEINCDQSGICGDFSRGTARQLVISTTADHITAPYDPKLITSVVSWGKQSFDLGTEPSQIKIPGFLVGMMLTFVGGVASGVSILSRSCQPLASRNLRVIWIRCMTWLMTILMGLIWGMAASEVAPSRNASNNLLLCYCILICSNYVMQFPQKGWQTLRVVCLYLGLGLVSFLVPTVILGIPEWWQSPAAIWQLPKFLLQWPLLTIYNYQLSLKLAFIPSYTLKLQPSLLFIGLVLIELVWPGMTLAVLERGAGFLVRWVRQPLRLTGIGKVSQKTVILIVGLTVIFIVVMGWQISNGLLELAMLHGGSTLTMIILFVLLPLTITSVTLRSSWFRRCEYWLFKN